MVFSAFWAGNASGKSNFKYIFTKNIPKFDKGLTVQQPSIARMQLHQHSGTLTPMTSEHQNIYQKSMGLHSGTTAPLTGRTEEE